LIIVVNTEVGIDILASVLHAESLVMFYVFEHVIFRVFSYLMFTVISIICIGLSLSAESSSVGNWAASHSAWVI